jgi:hypothetical protein
MLGRAFGWDGGELVEGAVIAVLTPLDPHPNPPPARGRESCARPTRAMLSSITSVAPVTTKYTPKSNSDALASGTPPTPGSQG